MKSNELRIGNIFRDKFNPNTIMKVYKLDHNIYFNNNFEANIKWQAEPIPLTEKWLIKLGLKKMPESEYTLNTYDFAGFKLWMNKDKFLFNDKISIEYVHQLQNLYFALTGEELKI